MHYGVVTKEHFMHNNMIPNTSKRDTFQNTNSNYRKYENLSGNDQYWNHKKENYIEHKFETVLKRKLNHNKKQKMVHGVNLNKEADKPDKIVVSFG